MFLCSSSIKKIISFSSILITTVAFHYPNIAYADVNGIPHNSDFPEAEYPYAKAPNGCGPGIFTNDRREIRDTWGPVDFTGACNTHDKCYYTLGSKWNTCNERFYSDLRAACERDLRTSIRVPAPTLRDPFRTRRVDLPPDPVRLTSCYTIATSYYGAVQTGVAFGIFKDAQNLQRDYERWVASVKNPSSSTSSGNISNPRPSAVTQGECRFLVGNNYSTISGVHEGVLTISSNSNASGNGTLVNIFSGSWRVKSVSEGQPVTVQTAGSMFLMIRDMGEIKQVWAGTCESDGFARGTIYDPSIPGAETSFNVKSQ